MNSEDGWEDFDNNYEDIKLGPKSIYNIQFNIKKWCCGIRHFKNELTIMGFCFHDSKTSMKDNVLKMEIECTQKQYEKLKSRDGFCS